MSKTLSQALHSVERLFPFSDYADTDMSNQYIERLYHENGLFYKLLHSLEGSMHMTISDQASSGARVHDVQTKKIATQIETLSQQFSEPIKVLELGCGKGYNIHYLAKRFPQVQFSGIDITSSYVREAKAKVKAFNNATIEELDMDQYKFDPSSFHLIYDIETVCHSQNQQQLLSKMYTTLKPEGLFILFDNFRKHNLDASQITEQKALQYIELAVGIPDGTVISDWLLHANKLGFETQINDDLSSAILSGLDRYHRMAAPYFNNPSLAKMINKVIPEKLKLYSIGAYLMKYSMAQGFQSYEEIVLKKKVE